MKSSNFLQLPEIVYPEMYSMSEIKTNSTTNYGNGSNEIGRCMYLAPQFRNIIDSSVQNWLQPGFIQSNGILFYYENLLRPTLKINVSV